MKRLICAVLTLAMLLCVGLPGAHAAEAEDFDGYLVGIPELRVQAAQRVDADMIQVRDDLYYVDSLADVAAMQRAGLVEFYEPNYPMYLMDTQWNMSMVNAPAVWDHQNADGEYDRRGTGVTIAVIDSGIRADNTDFIPEHILPYHDFYNNENGVDIWHGTFVAGLIAAQVNNGIGIDGAASDVTLLPICITKGGKSDTTVAIQAIDYAVEQGADIINLSIGGSKASRALEQACKDAVAAGVIIVAAAGNYEQDATNFSEKNYIYPAGYDCVVSVSGCKNTIDGPEFDSTYSYFNDKVNVCAPGSNIKSLYFSLGTASASGTSFATPIVSSMAAIAKQVNPAINQATFTTLVQDTATDLGEEGYDIYYGHGLVNMEAFCEALEQEYPIRYLSGKEEATFDGEVTRTYTVADPDLPLPTPVRDGYRFLGWYTNAALTGKPVTVLPTASIGEQTFYAAWQEISNAAPAITDAALAELTLHPASLDGKVNGTSLTADLREWFTDADGDALNYALVEGPGTLAGSSYHFAPTQDDAGKDYSVLLRATDARGAVSPVHTLRIHVSAAPNSTPVVLDTAPVQAQAVPASRDGSTGAVAYMANVGDWFSDPDGDKLTYTLVEGPGTLSGTSYIYIPAPEDAGKFYRLTFRAQDGAASAEHTMTLQVGAVPPSQSVLNDPSPVRLNLCELPGEISYDLTLYGNAVTGVTLDGEALVWRMEDSRLFVEAPQGLTEGKRELCIRFDGCESVTSQWSIVRDCPSAAFGDISTAAWYHSAVDYVVRQKLMNGVGDNRFAPGNPFTRAMLVTVLHRVAGEPAAKNAAPFGDVPQGMWYTEAVAWAAEKGIVNGTAPGTFAPNSPVTREQLVTILFRYTGDDGVRTSLNGFPDAAAVSGYAVDAMGWAIGHGIISGVAANGTVTLSPSASATRAQVATILMRFLTENA